MSKEPNENGIRAVVYLRVARADDTDSSQFGAQRQRCEEVAKQHRLALIKEYTDADGGWGPAEDRPGLSRLLEELPITRPRYVLVSDLARISRQVREVVAIDEYLMCVGAELLVHGEGAVHKGTRRRMRELLTTLAPGQRFAPQIGNSEARS